MRPLSRAEQATPVGSGRLAEEMMSVKQVSGTVSLGKPKGDVWM